MNFVLSASLTFTCTDCGATAACTRPVEERDMYAAQTKLAEAVRSLCVCNPSRGRVGPEAYRPELGGRQLGEPT